ncbi:hypothetical protein FB45DRAFT_753957 [Roridomyces roridus]|uniref:RING-type domain-containing protein n=1 Tax=Roridomyces roridus TaxID=1738132 RepID=A0AAD7BHM0_9AGAR|nr:hypothetical protein FB45DRAFT_753957 [Roridomyces roridus]
MLCLGPGSACDLCLEPFDTELRAPCSISCGHVFCANCLQHIARPTCPLCRTPFQARHTVKLHVDLDNIRVLASSDGVPPPANSDERARQLHQRITSVATEGATEAQTTQLTEECKAFLSTVPKTMYSELRSAYKMLYYICHVKRNFVEQGRTVNELVRNASTVSQDMDRLKASIEVLKLEKRNWEQAWQSVSAEKDDLSSECQRLHEQLENAQAQIHIVTECVCLSTSFLQRSNNFLSRQVSESDARNFA